MATVLFEVEQAGCPSCAARVRAALAPLGTVSEVAIDEQADQATVRLTTQPAVGENEVNRALHEASAGSGHGYRVRPGSWQSAA